MKKFYLRLRIAQIVIPTFLFISFAEHSASQPVVSLNAVITGLSSPIQLVNAGDGTNRIFIVQQGGTIVVYNQSYGLIGTFLTVSGVGTGGERGLLSMAFPPDYSSKGYFYVYYTNS